MTENSGKNTYTVQWVNRIRDIERTEWNAMALPLKTPLLEWDWLNQLEVSGSIAPAAGWYPRHLIIRHGGRLVAAAPLYIKTHSEGEFVFDYIWADVAGQLDIRYYPKLVGMSPVTPIPGYRFLVAEGEDENILIEVMLQQIDRFCKKNSLSGAGFLFVDPEWEHHLTRSGYLGWLHQTFVWENDNCTDFDDYLAPFKTNQRRNIRRERKAMPGQGLRLRTFVGDDIPESLIPLMYRFYERTNDQYGIWSCKYLLPAFFEGIFRHCRDRLLFVAAFAENDTEPVGMSMLLHKGEQILGRYWGCRADINYLHFNACYYEPIDWAIRNGVRNFYPGAGGAHKVRRGFTSIPAYSFHRFFDPRLDRVMRVHIGSINEAEQKHIDELNDSMPLARTNDQ